MKPLAYYNEHDPFAAEWLRNLISAGHIAYGIVDERDIRDVKPDDLRSFTQCHFFAGIGGWSRALRLADWSDHRPVWTGSCPCQPFSAAGRGAGFADERHLWPHWHWLISQCRPATIFGEQVASKDGLGWFDLVSSDLEGTGYAVGAADLCAAGVGAPHIRQRLYWVAERLDNAASARHVGALEDAEGNSRHEARLRVSGKGRGPCVLADANDARSQGWQRVPERSDECAVGSGGVAGELEHAARNGREERRAEPSGRGAFGGRGESPWSAATSEQMGLSGCARQSGSSVADSELGDALRNGNGSAAGDSDRTERTVVGSNWNPSRTCAAAGNTGAPHFWSDADWLPCRDGKARPVESGTFPLAHGIPGRVGRLRGFGNAIVPQVAAEFIGAYLDYCATAVLSPPPC